jgi:hypothetical protein
VSITATFVTDSLLGQNSSNSLSSNTLSLCSFLRINWQVLYLLRGIVNDFQHTFLKEDSEAYKITMPSVRLSASLPLITFEPTGRFL